ncbi:MAG TPA: hypothetical protein VKV02_07705, partial [Acidobacteriaceae bacterium]|nr:hypothetical protein [Acidobacteriaceae bacterium]
QSMYQKFFSAKSEADARRATVGWIIGTVILESVIVAVAVVGSALYRTGEVSTHPREVLAYTAVHAFGAYGGSAALGSEGLSILGALMVGAIFAKVVSTANNYLFSPATNLVNDVFVRYLRPDAPNKQVLLISRLMVVGLGLWALWQSLGTKSVLAKSLEAYTIYAAALTPVILAAFFWRRATAAGAVTSIAAGTLITLTWDTVRIHVPEALGSHEAILPALLISVCALIAVSSLTKRSDAAHLASMGEA